MNPDQVKAIEPSIVSMGDSAILIEFDQRIDLDIHEQVRTCLIQLEAQAFPGMLECVPAFASITVHYDPIVVMRDTSGAFKHEPSYDEGPGPSGKYVSPSQRVRSYVAALIGKPTPLYREEPRSITIPVWYGGEAGPDLEEVSRHSGLSAEEVIREHTAPEYTVYMIGFSPGFPYLGGMKSSIAVPRRVTPRLQVPAGSVGIGGGQTGVYSQSTPGGWQIIGRTPLSLFNPMEKEPSLLQAGDRVKFRAITEKEYGESMNGNFPFIQGGGEG
ncbi:5-oxoprolinase subunit PxpB [Paenibacillus shunpengii]|uniref:5-oxoprolinase subunit PxpB n=1 Tax=Paenibacillus shunpengii TaxID=2054424 RepID=A0ABW5SJD1_9BACL